MKTIGVIGGFGPEATAQFYRTLIVECRKRRMPRQPHVIVWNVAVPKTFEDDLLLRNKGIIRFKPILIHAAQELERVGCAVIILPCNTLHVFEHEIAESISIPFLSIIKSTENECNKLHVKRLGILGTSATIKNRLFEKIGKTATVKLPHALQIELDKGFHERVVNNSSKTIKKAVKRSLLFFQNAGISDVLLASTDLHGECPDRPKIQIHDTLDILARATVDML